MVVWRQPPTVIRSDHRTFGNRDERIMRFEVFPALKKSLVRRDERKFHCVGQLDRRRLQCAIIATQPLKLDIEAIPEKLSQLRQSHLRNFRMPFLQGNANRPARATRQTDQSFGESAQLFRASVYHLAGRCLRICRADDTHKVRVAFVRCHQQHDWREVWPLSACGTDNISATGFEAEIELHADDRLNPVF